jgi:hypothetical protein
MNNPILPVPSHFYIADSINSRERAKNEFRKIWERDEGLSREMIRAICGSAPPEDAARWRWRCFEFRAGKDLWVISRRYRRD